jgi:putative PIN family toxin of toxin-antitoxin system
VSRAVLDVNVLISAILSPTGAPARLLLAWQTGAYELIVSPSLLAELGRALGYPKIRRLIPIAEADAFVAWLEGSATLAVDPDGPPPFRSIDPAGDYLIALAADQRATLVTGDHHLLDLSQAFPVSTAGRFLATFAED